MIEKRLVQWYAADAGVDLDFTAMPSMPGSSGIDPETFILDVVGTLHDQTHRVLTFTIPAADSHATLDSCGAEVTYRQE